MSCSRLVRLAGARSPRGSSVARNFERAVGHDLSLTSTIERMRVAMGYPPCGLPVLIMGASGTGKTYLVKLMLEYTKHQFVRDKLSLRNIAVGSAAQFGAACDMIAKDLARRNVMQMVAVYEFFALGPLTAAGCPENYKIQHCRLSMVFATRNAWLTGTVAWSE